VARFKSQDGTRPFTYADDNHSGSVLIKNIARDRVRDEERDSIISISTLFNKDKPELKETLGSRSQDSSKTDTITIDSAKTESTIVSMA
jgi:hypothetical protein